MKMEIMLVAIAAIALLIILIIGIKKRSRTSCPKCHSEYKYDRDVTLTISGTRDRGFSGTNGVVGLIFYRTYTVTLECPKCGKKRSISKSIDMFTSSTEKSQVPSVEEQILLIKEKVNKLFPKSFVNGKLRTNYLDSRDRYEMEDDDYEEKPVQNNLIHTSESSRPAESAGKQDNSDKNNKEDGTKVAENDGELQLDPSVFFNTKGFSEEDFELAITLLDPNEFTEGVSSLAHEAFTTLGAFKNGGKVCITFKSVIVLMINGQKRVCLFFIINSLTSGNKLLTSNGFGYVVFVREEDVTFLKLIIETDEKINDYIRSEFIKRENM